MPMSEAEKERVVLRRRRRLRQVLGAVVCLLVVVGAVSIVRGGVSLVARAFDDSDLMAEFEQRLSTLVALDPLPFDSLDQANQNTLLNAAIWASIDTTNNEYERDENGQMYLPTVDIDRTAAALYGPDFHFTYETFEDHYMTFTYVPEKQAYLIPVTSSIGDYYPRVTRIQREWGGVRRVTVGYCSPFSQTGEFSPTASLEPVKYQDYLFQKDGDNYYLYAIVESESQVTSSSSTASASVPPAVAAPQEVADSIAQSVTTSTAASDSAVAAQSDAAAAASAAADSAAGADSASAPAA